MEQRLNVAAQNGHDVFQTLEFFVRGVLDPALPTPQTGKLSPRVSPIF